MSLGKQNQGGTKIIEKKCEKWEGTGNENMSYFTPENNKKV